MEEPKVSVIIPTYKRPKKLVRAVKSVRNQTYDNIEIIVVNDDPESDISDVLPEDENIKLINHEVNKGGAGARNTGIDNAEGKYIAFLDDDDYFLPEKIEKELELIESLDDDWIGVYSWKYRFKEGGEIRGPNKEGNLYYSVFTIETELEMGGVLFLKADVLKNIGGWDETFRRHQDWDLLIRLFKVGKIKVLKEPLWVGTRGNPPSRAEDAEENVLHFLNKFEDEINNMPRKKRRKTLGAHYLYIIPPYMEEGNFRKGFELLKKHLKFVPPFHHPYKYFQIFEAFIKYILKSN